MSITQYIAICPRTQNRIPIGKVAGWRSRERQPDRVRASYYGTNPHGVSVGTGNYGLPGRYEQSVSGRGDS